jgi:hypothetical protein
MTYEGYRRNDGLFDLECALVDVKDQDYALLTGVRRAGDPVHDMRARLTLDSELTVRDIEVSFDAMPYPGACDQIRNAYRKLIGARLLQGFRAALQEAMGGVQGCSHVTELLMHAPTPAIQMMAGMRTEHTRDGSKPFQLDSCHALETTTDTVRRYYPQWYRGAA